MSNEVETKRVRVSDEDFLRAVFASSSNAEVSAKTGQKPTTTASRLNRLRKEFEARGQTLPKFAKQPRTARSIDSLIELARSLEGNS